MALFEVKGWKAQEPVAEGKQQKKKSGPRAEKIAKKNKERKERKKLRKAADAERLGRESELEAESKAESKAESDDESELESEAESEAESEDEARETKPELKKETKKQKTEKAVTKAKESAPVQKLTPLQQKMMAKLSGSRFRWINEQLYTSDSANALNLIKEQPELFDAYHEGFRAQVKGWPENPVDTFVNEFRTRYAKQINAPGGLPGVIKHTANHKPYKEVVVADMGCGEAMFAKKVAKFVNKKKKSVEVHSFDLKKVNERITVADIRDVPMEDNSCSVVIFCLALMGTNFLDFIEEAYRILSPRGELWIAEIKSRFTDNGDEFVKALKLMGFFHKHTDSSNKMFTRFEFFKPTKEVIEERQQRQERKRKFTEVQEDKQELMAKRKQKPEGEWLLKPCIYKRR